MEELDAKPTLEELIKAIYSSTLLQPLYDTHCQWWRKCCVPQDMKDAKIVTYYKNKGDRRDCNN